jgi:hypothetical protein
VIGNVTVAQTGVDTSRDGITVAARGQNRERTDVTDSAGTFQLLDAPTGEILVAFRRGTCEGSFPLGAVPSNATINLTNLRFTCSSDPFASEVAAQTIAESFRAVAHANGSDVGVDLRLCVRVGDDNRVRTIQVPDTAEVRDEGGRAIGRGALRERDFLQIDGERSTTGGVFTFRANRVAIVATNARNDCDRP